MAKDEYHVLWRGQLTGPFELDELLEQVSQDRLSKLHQISTDKKQWVAAATLGELFPPFPLPSKLLRLSDSNSRGLSSHSMGSGAPDSDQTIPGTSPDTHSLDVEDPREYEFHAETDDTMSGWYYAVGRETKGPCTIREIVDLLSEGLLTWQNKVCHESKQEWLSLTDVPEFAPWAPDSGGEKDSLDPQLAMSAPLHSVAAKSMTLGLVGLVIPVCGIIALYYGVRSKDEMGAHPAPDAKRMAQLGTLLGALGVCLDVVRLGLLLYFIMTSMKPSL